MWTYGLKPEHLAKIAVINRRNGYYNEKAGFGALIDIDTVLKSPMVADPLHLYDCNTHADGAAAAVIGAGEAIANGEGAAGAASSLLDPLVCPLGCDEAN